MAETYCEMTVAEAAPATPKGMTRTNKISKKMFNSAHTARNSRGTLELPTARSKEAKKLYTKVHIRRILY